VCQPGAIVSRTPAMTVSPGFAVEAATSKATRVVTAACVEQAANVSSAEIRKIPSPFTSVMMVIANGKFDQIRAAKGGKCKSYVKHKPALTRWAEAITGNSTSLIAPHKCNNVEVNIPGSVKRNAVRQLRSPYRQIWCPLDVPRE